MILSIVILNYCYSQEFWKEIEMSFVETSSEKQKLVEWHLVGLDCDSGIIYAGR